MGGNQFSRMVSADRNGDDFKACIQFNRHNSATRLRCSASHWAYDAIQTVYQNQLTGGYPDNTFKPNNQITVQNLRHSNKVCKAEIIWGSKQR